MRRIRDVFTTVFNALTMRALIIIMIVAFLFPLLFANVEFRRTLSGSIQVATFMYTVPALASFLLVRLYCVLQSIHLSPVRQFFFSWLLACLLIANSFVAPMLIDLMMFSFYNYNFVHGFFDYYSVRKFAVSYFDLFGIIAECSLPALFVCYGLFVVSASFWPVTEYTDSLGKIYRNSLILFNKIVSRIRQLIPEKRIIRIPSCSTRFACLLVIALWPPHSTLCFNSQFAAIDRDHNGTIERPEFDAWVQSTSMQGQLTELSFDRIDTKHDDKIDPDEWKRYWNGKTEISEGT